MWSEISKRIGPGAPENFEQDMKLKLTFLPVLLCAYHGIFYMKKIYAANVAARYQRFLLLSEGNKACESLGWFTVYNVFAAFFKREFRASTIQSTVAIEATIKVLGHANILLDIATNDSFRDENEGDAVDSKANNNGIADAVEAKVTNGHAEQEAIDQMMLPYLQLQITAKFEYI
ncbi:hypothetical protein MAM1_0001c00109 [Mucor ambiguus]|uniref:Uncharacterized protein n=1 Tax=Mucor ambiguus TaxID=91626 RepID=A0A0C9MCM6_9FUNG|nr:hypothetical protein MAM1_0001c00109 [Mucor ambiguus]